MSDIGEGIGTAVEGGLFARALDPKSGAKERHPGGPDNCLNCGTALTGAYCHTCGQPGHVHRTIGAFMHDLLHGALHFEGKMWRTLPMLVLRPGRLTRRYIEGARARFVSPMALFLFSVFLMFAVFQVLGISAPTDLPTAEEAEFTATDVAQEIRDGIRQAQEEVPDAADGELTDTQRELVESLEVAENALDDALAGTPQDGPIQAPDAPDAPAQQVELDEDGNARMSVNFTGIDWIDNGIARKWQDNPSLMIYKMQANSYKFSWLLIPLSIPFVWLLFVWKRRFRGYDHAIFVTYSLSFMTLLFVALSLAGAGGVTGVWLFTIFAIAAPWHIYRQLRGAYELSRFSALWRLMMLIGFIFVILLLFLQVLLVLGAF